MINIDIFTILNLTAIELRVFGFRVYALTGIQDLSSTQLFFIIVVSGLLLVGFGAAAGLIHSAIEQEMGSRNTVVLWSLFFLCLISAIVFFMIFIR